MLNSKDNSVSFILRSLFLFVFSFALISCGSSGGSDDDDSGNNSGAGDDSNGGSGGTTGGSGGQSKVGFVEVNADGSEVDFSAGFIEFAANIPVDTLKDSFVPKVDSCEVSKIGGDGSFEIPDINGVDSSSIKFISAGETIQFSEPAGGTYGEMMRFAIAGITGYRSDNSVPGSIPTGLIVDILGDEFPAFSNVSVPNVGKLDVTSPKSDSAITPETTFSWNASGDPDTYIQISATSFSAGLLSVNCKVLDDGRFSFPSVTKGEMGAGFSGSAVDFITRTATKIVEANGAILIVNSSSSASSSTNSSSSPGSTPSNSDSSDPDSAIDPSDLGNILKAGTDIDKDTLDAFREKVGGGE